MRAAVYLRISQDRNGDGLAIDRQRDDCYRLAEQRGWTVVNEYADKESASDKRKARPGYDKMVTAYERGEFEALICWDLDRLTRQPRQLEDWIDAAEERGLAIVTANGEADLSTDGGRLFTRVKAGVARGEVERKSTRQRRAHEQHAKSGRKPDRRAFGYRSDGTLHPVEAPAVEEIFNRFVAGASIVALTRWLNEQGHHTTTCKCQRCAPDLDESKRSAPRPWDRSSVRFMLGSLRYAGIRLYKGEEVGPGDWPAIVPEETVRAAIDILADPARHEKLPSTARKWLGSGLYLCGKCAARGIEATMAVAYGTNGYRQYRCSRLRDGGCWMTRAADPIDEHVEGLITARLRRPDLRDLLAEAAPDLAPLRTEAAALRQRLQTLAGDLNVDERTLEIRDRALREKLSEVEEQLAAAGRTSALAGVAAAPDPGEAWLELDDIRARQEVVRELATVTLLPVRRGQRTFDPATVTVEPRHRS